VTTDSAANTYTWDPNWGVLTNFNNSDPMTRSLP
jgi:hypothetical protein